VFVVERDKDGDTQMRRERKHVNKMCKFSPQPACISVWIVRGVEIDCLQGNKIQGELLADANESEYKVLFLLAPYPLFASHV
jgi:hypothetical protein